MLILPYILAVVTGAFLQIGTIYFLRGNLLSGFLYTVPLILLYQFLFLWSYAKAPNFLIIWFITTALTNGLAFLVSYFLLHEQVSLWNWFGIGFVIVGIILLNIK